MYPTDRSVPRLSLEFGEGCTMDDVDAAVPSSEVPPSFDDQLFAQAVPRGLVHKAAVSEVLPTALIPVTGDACRVALQWPRNHSFYVGAALYDPLILAESIRQAGMVAAHRLFAVPVGFHFLIRELSFDADDELWKVGDVPGRLIVDVRASEIRHRAGIPRSMRQDFTVWRSGTRAATGSASFDCIPPRVYTRVRGEGAVAGASCVLSLGSAPSYVHLGDRLPRGVALEPTTDGSRWHLMVDRGHPVLFDHPVDHVPGMGLMEGVQQAARLLLGPASRVAAMHLAFRRFIDFGTPCEVVGEVVGCETCGDAHIRVTYQQNGLEMGIGRARVVSTAGAVPLAEPGRAGGLARPHGLARTVDPDRAGKYAGASPVGHPLRSAALQSPAATAGLGQRPRPG